MLAYCWLCDIDYIDIIKKKPPLDTCGCLQRLRKQFPCMEPLLIQSGLLFCRGTHREIMHGGCFVALGSGASETRRASLSTNTHWCQVSAGATRQMVMLPWPSGGGRGQRWPKFTVACSLCWSPPTHSGLQQSALVSPGVHPGTVNWFTTVASWQATSPWPVVHGAWTGPCVALTPNTGPSAQGMDVPLGSTPAPTCRCLSRSATCGT